MHHSLDSATLSQLAFPGEKQPEFPVGEIPLGQYSCTKQKSKVRRICVKILLPPTPGIPVPRSSQDSLFNNPSEGISFSGGKVMTSVSQRFCISLKLRVSSKSFPTNHVTLWQRPSACRLIRRRRRRRQNTTTTKSQSQTPPEASI